MVERAKGIFDLPEEILKTSEENFQVIVAGSLLGISMHLGTGFPVGNVDILHVGLQRTGLFDKYSFISDRKMVFAY